MFRSTALPYRNYSMMIRHSQDHLEKCNIISIHFIRICTIFHCGISSPFNLGLWIQNHHELTTLVYHDQQDYHTDPSVANVFSNQQIFPRYQECVEMLIHALNLNTKYSQNNTTKNSQNKTLTK